MGRDQAHVVLYEDNSRRNVNALIAALRGLQVRIVQPSLGPNAVIRSLQGELV